MNEIDDRLALEFEKNAEWKAYQARVARILTKRNAGRSLNKEENAILADYQVALCMGSPPKHKATGEDLPPILYSYTEAEEAFPLDRAQLYGLRSKGCPAFTGNVILSATLAKAIAADPNPQRAAINAVHTGRRGKLTPELHESIVKALETCPVLTTVAGAHGVTQSALSVWRDKGENWLSLPPKERRAEDKKYADFFIATEASLAQARLGLIRDISTDPDWRAKLAILERTQPQEWGRRQALEHTGAAGGPIATEGTAAVTFVLQGLPPGHHNPFAPQTGETAPPTDG